MSPYQQQVIDATMSQLDRDLQQQQAQLGASAGSAFGGGRFGVAQGELAAQGALNKALTTAQLQQQGFGLANQLAAQAAQQQLLQVVSLHNNKQDKMSACYNQVCKLSCKQRELQVAKLHRMLHLLVKQVASNKT